MPMLTSVLFDKDEWETPDTFNPGHFLDAEGKFVRKEAHLPFSAGKPCRLTSILNMTQNKHLVLLHCVCVFVCFRETCVSWRGPGQDGAVPVFGSFTSEVLFHGSWRSRAEYRRSYWSYSSAAPLQGSRQGSLKYATSHWTAFHWINV